VNQGAKLLEFAEFLTINLPVVVNVHGLKNGLKIAMGVVRVVL